MRLLYYDDAGKIRLTEDLPSRDIPPYAILSHTWGDEEVLFKDLIDGIGERKADYAKLKFCGDQAGFDGLKYFWVDTCCIDKSDHTELQEAINSMFRWYRYAARCYVYLADVSTRTPDNLSSWEPAFLRSRWFTRGWTLQELIAPKSVVFFSNEGVRLGDKKTLEKHIHNITGVPVDVLQGRPLSDVSVSDRMSWIGKRNTTRQEDKAYSLLGIFDVHMPLLYGEGGESAFRRLQEEISKMLYWEGRSRSEINPASHSIQPDQETIADSGYGSGGTRAAGPWGELKILVPMIHESTTLERLEEETVHDRQDDECTVYSDTQSLRDLDVRPYIAGFVRELSDRLSGELGSKDIDEVVLSLPSMLKTFAYKMGHESTAKENREVMYFVHRYRQQITEKFKLKLLEEADIEAENVPRQSNDDGMSLNDKMSMWRNREGINQEDNTIDQHIVSGSEDDNHDLEDLELPELSALREVLTHTSAFAWLLSAITAESKLQTPGSENIMEAIRDQLLKIVKGPNRLSRHFQHQVTIVFELDWDFPAFYKAQQYKCTIKDALENAITVTGKDNQVQTATVLQYMCQVWPETGHHLLNFLGQLFDGESLEGKSHQGIFPGGLSVFAQYRTPVLIFQASGDRFSVAELGTKLSWLGAALRASPSDIEPCSCIPILQISNAMQRGREPKDGVVCRIEYHLVLLPQSSAAGSQASGACWRSLLRNPTIVEGFPIPRRSRPNSGMETTLDILAALIKGQRMVEFCGTTFIKGFSAMLVAVVEESETLYWHLYFNEDGSYISYEDPRVPRASSSGIEILKKGNFVGKQHILGWCVAMKNYAGAHDANYSIGWSGLPSPAPHCAFEKVSITGGKFITAGVTCAIGVKDRAVHIGFGDDYIGMLMVISSRYFVFYDRDDRRAWLVDGASGLLHFLRASIKQFQDDRRLRRLFCFDENEFEESNETHNGSDSAFEVLSNMSNRTLPLYPKKLESWHERITKLGTEAEDVQKEKTAMFSLEDLVEQLCHVLGQIMAHQDDMNTDSGVGFKVKLTPRRQLEGFDFMDVATGHGTFWPKMATLHATGAGWVDFTRTVHAITFFGTGFGHLFTPTGGKPCGVCMWNGEVPEGRDYLAATVRDIKDIIKRKGCMRNNPWRLAGNIYWHTPDKLFEPCKCHPSGSGGRMRHDRVQVLLPATFPKLWTSNFRSPTKLAAQGAVIFGHSWKFPLRWRSHGDPEEGEPEPLAKQFEALFIDSDIDLGNRTSVRGSSTDPFPNPDQEVPGSSDSATWPSLYSQSNSRFIHYDRSAETSQMTLDSEQGIHPGLLSSLESGHWRVPKRPRHGEH